MNKLFTLCAAFMALTALTACKEEQGSRVVTLAESPQGRAFHFMPVYEDGVTDITVRIAWPIDWAEDAAFNPAVPHVLTDMMMNAGSGDLTPQDVDTLFGDTNSYGHLTVRADHIIGELGFPKEHVDAIVPVVARMLAEPQYDAKWVERIRGGIEGNERQAAQQSANQLWDAARQAILGQGRLTEFLSLLDPSDIRTVKADALHDWHTHTLVQADAVIAVTGAISQQDAGEVVDTLMSGLPAGGPSTPPQTEADFTPRTILLHLPNAPKSTLGFLGRLPETKEGGDLVDTLALIYFSRQGGPLMTAMRDELRASYGFGAGALSFDRATRFLIISGEVETDKLAEAVAVARETYEEFRTDPDMSALPDIRMKIAESTSDNVQYVDVAARTILELAIDGRDTSIAPRLGEELGDVTEDQIKARMETVFPRGEELISIAVSPDANALPGACVISRVEDVESCR